jgi:hypothetical protein
LKVFIFISSAEKMLRIVADYAQPASSVLPAVA